MDYQYSYWRTDIDVNKSVKLSLPSFRSLNFNCFSSVSRYNYLNADMRIETTMTANDPETVVQAARSYNSKMCGQPGEYIIAPPQFFLNSNGATVKKYGDPGKQAMSRNEERNGDFIIHTPN